MSEASDTPEVDAELSRIAETYRGTAVDAVMIHFARRLERDRDEARKGDWYQACIAIATRLAPITKAPGIVDAVDELLAERNQLRARVAELEGAKWEAVYSGYHWWIADEKTGDLIEMIAGPENEIAQGIVKAHNLTLTKKEADKA